MPLPYNVGDEISYIHINRHRDYNFYPVMTQYQGTRITGIVRAIRDLEVDKLNYKTVSKTPEIERSQYLITVKTVKGIRKDYDGRMVDIQIINKKEQVDDDLMQALSKIK